MSEDLLFGDIYYRMNDFRPGRKTLLFVHGLSGSSSAWAEYEEELGKAYNVFSFDLRGHGKSRKPAAYAEYEIRHFAKDLDALVKHLHIADPILISHSFATFVVLEYLETHQAEVSGVVFLSPNPAPNRGVISALLRPLLRAVRKTGFLAHIDRRGGHIDYKAHPQKGDWDIRAGIQDIRNTGLRVYLYSLEQSLGGDYTSFLKEIKIPILLIHGRKDGYFPLKNSILMNRAIPHSQIKIIEGADHIIVKNNFLEVAAFIKDFVEELPEGKAKLS
ncbi:MAG: hypothetical protein JWN89_176 [Parcubacteria group bacterium]|nr:hypothetical protein [Parcubacteria group bacterium]